MSAEEKGLDLSGDDRPIIVVMVGTHHSDFSRLVRWVDLVAASRLEWRVIVQYGNSKAPQTAEGQAFFTPAEMHTLVDHASALVAHGGPSIMMEWCRRGDFLPIIVPRDPKLKEHIDEHQILFSKFMEDRGLIRVAHTSDELRELVDKVMGGELYRMGVLPPDPSGAAKRVGEIAKELVAKKEGRGK